LETSQFEIDIEFTLQGDLKKQNGFVIKLTPEEQSYPENFGTFLGTKDYFHGLGILLSINCYTSLFRCVFILIKN
jgi:hypothetical protein